MVHNVLDFCCSIIILLTIRVLNFECKWILMKIGLNHNSSQDALQFGEPDSSWGFGNFAAWRYEFAK